MNGIILVNKPENFTSFDVCAKMRGILHIKRIGHAGTLDPMATGVLPVFVGKATKACDIMPDSSKAYRANVKFGVETDTLDRTGTVTETFEKKITESDIISVLPKFKGEITQIPPMYSAVKVNGKKLYELARQGKTVERPERKVTIEKLELEKFDEENQTAVFYIECSSGTYIRTLADDIAKAAGSGAYLTDLVRTKAAGFDISQTFTLEQIQQMADENRVEDAIISVDKIFSDMPKITLSAKQTVMYKNGVKLYLKNIKDLKNGVEKYTVYSDKNEFLGIAKTDTENEVLKIGKNFF